MKEIRIVFFLDHFGGGGVQEYLYQISRYLDKSKFNITIVALHVGSGQFLPRFQELGIKIIVLSSTRHYIGLEFYYNFIKLIKTYKFDVVHSFLPGGFLFALMFSTLTRTPLIHSIHSVPQQGPKWYFPMMGLMQGRVYAYVGFDEKALRNAGISPAKIKITELLLDFDNALSIDKSGKDGSSEQPILLSIGRLHVDKGHEFAIRVMPYILQKWPSAKLIVVGDGNDRNRLENIVKELDISLQVEFTGYQSNLIPYLSKADIMLRTSVNEGMNITIILGMAAGLPIVGFDAGIPKDFIVDQKTGLLVPLKDIQSLAKAVILLLESRSLQYTLAQRARQALVKYFDRQKFLSYQEYLYKCVATRLPSLEISDLKDAIWPQFNPFAE